MHYYIESDGKVYLIERNGLLDLPRKEEVPFPFTEEAPLATSEPVVFCSPHLPRYPREWLGKDELASRSGVSPLVREAIHAGMPRVVVEGICLDRGRILLVKGSRGLTKGRWSLPGGFLRFGETPADGLCRELREELNITAHIDSLLGVRAKLGKESRLHWLMVFYRIAISGEIHPDPDEISEARYFSLQRAADIVLDNLMAEVIRSLL